MEGLSRWQTRHETVAPACGVSPSRVLRLSACYNYLRVLFQLTSRPILQNIHSDGFDSMCLLPVHVKPLTSMPSAFRSLQRSLLSFTISICRSLVRTRLR